MTVYRPMVSDNNIRIKECTSAEYELMLQQIGYLYSQDPSVELSVVTSNGNISPSMTDTRYRSGAAERNTSAPWPTVTNYPTEADTQEPQVVTTLYDKISQTVTAPSSPVISYPGHRYKPVRPTSNGVQEMTYQDILDTFIDPVVTRMVGANGTDAIAAGAYYISTAASISGSTNLGLVYRDTAADIPNYNRVNIGDGVTPGQIFQDIYTFTDFRLYQIDGVSSVGGGWRGPLVVDYTNNGPNNPAGLRHMTQTEFDDYFAPLIRHAIYSYTGMTLRYNVDGSGTTQGTAMTNTVLDAATVTGDFQTYDFTTNDYRAQEFPNGTLITANTYELKLERT